MKINNWTILKALVFAAAVVSVGLMSACKQQERPEGYTVEDVTVRDGAYISTNANVWKVALIMTNTDDAAILKVIPPGVENDSPAARYAMTTDGSITQGMSVRLIEVGCFKSPGDTVAFGGRQTRSLIAIRADQQGSFKRVVIPGTDAGL
jgi:hypothetical protein